MGVDRSVHPFVIVQFTSEKELLNIPNKFVYFAPQKKFGLDTPLISIYKIKVIPIRIVTIFHRFY